MRMSKFFTVVRNSFSTSPKSLLQKCFRTNGAKCFVASLKDRRSTHRRRFSKEIALLYKLFQNFFLSIRRLEDLDENTAECCKGTFSLFSWYAFVSTFRL